MVQAQQVNERDLRKQYVDLSWKLKERIDELASLEKEYARLKELKIACENEEQIVKTLQRKSAWLWDRTKRLTASIPHYKTQSEIAKRKLENFKMQADPEQTERLKLLTEETACLRTRLDGLNEQLAALRRMPKPEPTPALSRRFEGLKMQLAKQNQKLESRNAKTADLQRQLEALATA